MQELYLKEGLKYVPKIITLCCTDKLNPLYGCMDREFWHYKTVDFPCGMSQEFVLTLAIVYKYNLDTRFYKKDFIKELIIAALTFAQRSAHKDGSCDDYYPFEKALGASAFSFYAFTESCLLIEGIYEQFEPFLRKRADWLFNSKESGVLSNHHAIIATALYNLYLLSKDIIYRKMAYIKLEEISRYQDPEGWFLEYTGADTGYLTFTVDFLAKLYSKCNDNNLISLIIKAVDFLKYFIHPDGSFGGEYNSRNTYIFLPHGLEIIGKLHSPALRIADYHLKGLASGKNISVSDNRIFGHFSYNYLQAFLDFTKNRNSNKDLEEYEKYFSNAGLFVKKTQSKLIIINLKKGGVVKVFDEHGCVYSNTGFFLKLSNNRSITNALFDKNISIKKNENTFFLKKDFCYVKNNIPSITKFFIFRLFLYTFGRFYWISRLVRKILQKFLITNFKKAPFSMTLEMKVLKKGIFLKYSIFNQDKFTKVKKGYLTTNFNPLYTAMGDCFQETFLINWEKININPLNNGGSLSFKLQL